MFYYNFRLFSLSWHNRSVSVAVFEHQRNDCPSPVATIGIQDNIVVIVPVCLYVNLTVIFRSIQGHTDPHFVKDATELNFCRCDL